MWAISEQLIESGRAAAIQRRLVWRHGRPQRCGTLRAPPSPECLAGRSPAELEACGLAGKRALATIRAAREVAAGRVDLAAHEPSLAAPAQDPEHRRLDGGVAGVPRARAATTSSPPVTWPM